MLKSVRHLGNYFDSTFNEQTDCKIKKGQFIGLVNKFISSFQNLKRNVLVRLFKSHCCFMAHMFGNINQRVSRNVRKLLQAEY